MPPRIRIGSRPSRLALAQAAIVKNRLQQILPGLECEVVPIRTTGDKLTTPSLAQVGGKGLFVRELEQALEARRVDIAVHSMKDLPAVTPPRFRLIAVPPREDAIDVLLSAGPAIAELPRAARLGTSSLRRRFEALLIRPDLDVQPLRGNIDTRLARLKAGEFDAIILAAAGLRRLGQTGLPAMHPLREEDFVPAGGQGALAIEGLAEGWAGGSSEIEDAVSALDDAPARIETGAERACLAAIGASCASPIGVKAAAEGGTLTIRALLFSLDGTRSMADRLSTALTFDFAEAEETGRNLARRMLAGGAAELIGDGSA
jgi:hydroxymethylbilane synthase